MLDLAVVLLFIVYSVAAGLRSRKAASKSLREYFLAGHTLKGWQAGTSMAATQFAADTPLLVTGLVATGGIFLVWRLWIYGLAFLCMSFIFAACWRRAGVITDAELTEIRYSGRAVLWLRLLKAIYYGTVINCVVLAMVLVAAIRIAEVFLLWHQWLPAGLYQSLHHAVQWSGIVIASQVTGLKPTIASTNNILSLLAIVGFTALYSMTGGLRSVVATDVMQFVLAMIGVVAYAVVVIMHSGGLGGMIDRLVEEYGEAQTQKILSFTPEGGEVLLPFLVVIGLQWLFQMNSDGTGYLAQRSMACAEERGARAAGVLFAWLQIFWRSLFWLLIAVGLLVLYPFSAGEAGQAQFAASREILFVQGINDLLPAGLRGLMLTGLLAALASTVDTHLNWGASYWSNDIYRRLIAQQWLQRQPQRRELVLVARLSNLLILVISLTVMLHLGSIQQAWYISLLFGAGMGSVLVLRWLWERINLYSEVAAIAVSLVVAPLLLYATDEEWLRLSLMALASTTAAILVTWWTPATHKETLLRFYQRVQPVGFWRRTAEEAGDDPLRPRREFLRGLGYALLTAASLFLLLVGVGRLLLPAPHSNPLFSWLLVAAGLSLIPLWWKGLSAPWGNANTTKETAESPSD